MSAASAESEKGLLLVYTGDGKGKTTAGLGQAIRAAGQGMKVCVVQFIKGTWQTGESMFLSRCESIEFHTLGSGFTWQAADKSEVVEVATRAWDFAREKIMSDAYDLIILDELTYLLNYRIIGEDTFLDMMHRKPGRLHLVVTGRDACAALVDRADLVTEMKMIKHPYTQGIQARKGIEF